jgi:DNA-binding response OmpR family regulator
MHAQQILFVDDDVLISYSSCLFLRDRGFRVMQADSACAAATVLDQLPYLSGLVTDIDLGAGEDGFDLARRMRAAYPGAPVVFVSGTASLRHAAEGVEGSVFIGKPYHPSQIAEALHSLSIDEAAVRGQRVTANPTKSPSGSPTR